MLDENQVVGFVCSYLQSKGYVIVSRCATTQQGIDIVASKSKSRVLVEAKGATSSRAGSERYKKGFAQAQVFDRVAKGAYTALKLNAERQAEDKVMLAFPKTAAFDRYVAPISATLNGLGIGIFFVAEDGAVDALNFT